MNSGKEESLMDEKKQEYSKADLAAILMGISRSTERLAMSLAEESKIEKMKGERKHESVQRIIVCRI